MKNKFTVFFLLLILHANIVACDSTENTTSASLFLPGLKESPKRGQVPVISSLEKIIQRGKLIVLTANSPTTYYYDRDNQLTGPEYEMTKSFAKSLQLEVEYKVYDSTKAVLNALRQNEGDIAAASLTVTAKREKEFDFGSVYQKIHEHLVCHRSKKTINNDKGLNGLDIVIAADSSYIESIKAYPEASWTVSQNFNTADLIKQVAEKKIECTISDSTLYNIERRYHTEIKNIYTLATESELAWMLNKHNENLIQEIKSWFKQYKEGFKLAYMLEKYYGFVEIFDYVDTHKFLKRVKTRLPEYKDFFIKAANENELDASLLAAQSYQESHWDRKAKSPTGVRGIMMLTQPVAKSLGVTNRLHAEQNIFAGAKFQAKMKKMVEQVDEPDRSWLALAAYNIGRGHFRDAQSLAKKLKKNPDYWHDMKEILPLLSQKKYYKDLRYGYARGNEPVRYVTRIRGYDGLLHKHFAK